MFNAQFTLLKTQTQIQGEEMKNATRFYKGHETALYINESSELRACAD